MSGLLICRGEQSLAACVDSPRMGPCAGGGIIRSSVATRYQLGLARHAGSVTAPPSAPTLHGT